MKQNRLVERRVTDDFVKSLDLTPEKINEDMKRVKNIEGFPSGEDEDIIELSNLPYYAAFPSPHIKQFIDKFGIPYSPEKDNYKREPFVGDVSEGKNDGIYKAHFYHTKVPPNAITPLIEHYTEKNEVVMDAFCGTGMTGIAARRCNRNAILIDLGVAPTFIASAMNANIPEGLQNECETILQELNEKFGEFYQTMVNGKKHRIVYSVWSEKVFCPNCKKNLALYDIVVKNNITQQNAFCPNCSFEADRTKFIREKDKNGKNMYKLIKIIYEDKINSEKNPDQSDFDVLKRVENYPNPYWVPLGKFETGDKTQEFINKGHFLYRDVFTERNILVISYLFDRIRKISEKTTRNILFSVVTSGFLRLTKLARYMPEYEHRHVGALSGTFYLPFFFEENNPIAYFEKKVKQLTRDYRTFEKKGIVSCQSATDLSNIPDNSIDYIFVDPPFGDNIMYSELNSIIESWLKIRTNSTEEAIINRTQRKDLEDYKLLMKKAFGQFYLKLKPNRWITIEFHNSKASVWKTIQESLVYAGFVIAQVAVIDKQKGTVNQMSYAGTVKNDLMINAYKPTDHFRSMFLKKAGLNLEKDFLTMHLENLPVEPNIERSRQMLYSKLLAQYIQNGFEVRMDASEFYGLLKNNFVERDGFWFNSEQLTEYEKRLKLKKNVGSFNLSQTLLGIDSEKTAIIWLSQFLRSPKNYSEILIEYNKSLLTSVDKIPELKLMLEENFVTEDGKYRLPSIAEKKEKEDFREKRLNKEFQEMLQEANSGKKIVDVRKEALLYGLIQLYNKKAVDQIRVIGKKVDNKILESDDEIYAIVDWAMSKDD